MVQPVQVRCGCAMLHVHTVRTEHEGGYSKRNTSLQCGAYSARLCKALCTSGKLVAMMRLVHHCLITLLTVSATGNKRQQQ